MTKQKKVSGSVSKKVSKKDTKKSIFSLMAGTKGKANIVKVETFLPLFPGFYDWLEFTEYDDESVELGECTNVEIYKAYAKLATKVVNEDMEDNDFGLGVFKFKELISPRFYNFSNDEILVDVMVDLNKVNKLTQTNKFKSWLKERFKSVDGACYAFVSKEPKDYIMHEDVSPQEAYVVIEFLTYDEEFNYESFFEQQNEAFDVFG